MFAENIHPFIKAPLFPVNPLYDSWSIPNILGINCVTGDHSISQCSAADRAHLEDYQKATKAVLDKIVSKKGNGAWAPSCADHTYVSYGAWLDPNHYAVPVNSNFNIHESVHRWYLNASATENHAHIDSQPWPSNTGCSGSTIFNANLVIES